MLNSSSKLSSLNSNNNAIPFIIYDQKEGFVLNKEAETYLNSMPKDRKLGVISIVGKYRTGKSFFVNRVLLEQGKTDKGFQVGPTVNPCTKGLWLWKKELLSSEDDNMDILLIDTEGFGGMDENLNHDSRIFLFSLLLSSYFIYNSQGSIDENALNSLSLIINLAKDIQLKSNQSNQSQEDPANYFPSFLWVVRDFALEMVDPMGNKISSKDYLEKALELQKGVSDAIESKNRIRKLMKHFFKERDCATLVRPVETEKELQNLDSLSNEELRSEFTEQITSLRKKIFKRVKPKMLCGRALNGQMLVEVCKAYTNAINKGSLPNIENAWTYVKKNEAQKALELSISGLSGFLEQQSQNEAIEPNKLETLKEAARQEMKRILRKNALGEEEELQEYFTLIEQPLDEKFREFKKHNKLQWKKKYSLICSEKIENIEKKLKNEEYMNFLEFQDDLRLLKDEFEKSVPKRDKQAEKYFTEISEQLHKSAAERVSRRQEREHYKSFKQVETMLALTETELKNKKQEFYVEKQRNQEIVQKLERDLLELQAKEHARVQNQEKLQVEYAQLSKAYGELKESQKEELEQREKDSKKRLRELELATEANKTDGIRKQASFEKHLALLEQETSFSHRENKALLEKINFLENENRKIRSENTSHLQTIANLKHKVDEQAERTNRELHDVQNDFEKKVLEIKSETDRKKDIIKQHSEFLIEKTYLENQVSFYKSQLEENKKLHEALLLALQQGMEKQENNNGSSGELQASYRNLSVVIEKLEMRCGILMEKNKKLKEFKKAVNNSMAMQCMQCSNFIPSNAFMGHYPSCQGQNISNLNSKNINNTKSSSVAAVSMPSIPQSVINLDPQAFSVSINQTMVRESPENNKPYTEYLIQLSYGMSKWEIARKYKHFCELHQQLMTAFPGLKFPDSSLAIINSATDISNIFSHKRPTVIEERRKALQQYLLDLIQIEIVRNSKALRIFLDVEKNIEKKISGSKIPFKNSENTFQQDPKLSTSFLQHSSYNHIQQSSNNVHIPEQMTLNSKQDKNFLLQSPSSFLRQWNEKALNKENSSRIVSQQNEGQQNMTRGSSNSFSQIPSMLTKDPFKSSKNELSKKRISGQYGGMTDINFDTYDYNQY